MKTLYVVFAVLLFLITGCKSIQHLNEDTIAGSYVWVVHQEERSLLGMHCKNLDLNEDSTFTYRSWEDIDYCISRGTWHTDDKYIYLHSVPMQNEVNLSQNDTAQFIVSKAELTDSNFTTIRIIKQDSTPQLDAICAVKSQQTYQRTKVDDTGTFYFSLKPVELIEIDASGMKPMKFYNKELKANKFEFIMLPRQITHDCFENKELKIEKGRLYDESNKNDYRIEKIYPLKFR